MKIVICAGGTGSIALQRGLYEMLDSRVDGVDTKILVNAYDDGLSTGTVRRVMGGHILGPSDVRKNQTTRLELENPKSPWLAYLNIRFTEESSEVPEIAHSLTRALERDLGKLVPEVHAAIDTFFGVPVALKTDYNDFSLANIIYAGLAKQNNNSLRKAAAIMARLMGINDNVILNDDRSMFLGAVTKSGKRITDEGDIVSWGNLEDPFVDIFFTDPEGYGDPEDGFDVNPVLCEEANQALRSADLIVLSSGTQWSSLIPTYASLGFNAAIHNSSAKIIMVMNRQPDKDSPGQTASEIIKILVPKYFPEKRLHVLADIDGHQNMNSLDAEAAELVASFTKSNMSISDSQTKHHPRKLAKAIATTYFWEYLDSDYYMFDYDDTLVGRGNKNPLASNLNVHLISSLNEKIQIGICTGNSIKAVNLKGYPSGHDSNFDPRYASLTVFADGGVNKYWYETAPSTENSDDGVSHTLLECVKPEVKLKTTGAHGITKLIRDLREAGIPVSKIENRGGVMLTIKPIDQDYREIVLNLVKHILRGSGLIARAAGRTTIEICSPYLSKIDAIMHVLADPKVKTITYVGDELRGGNDAVLKQLSTTNDDLKCLEVKDPVKTAFFLITLSEITPHV